MSERRGCDGRVAEEEVHRGVSVAGGEARAERQGAAGGSGAAAGISEQTLATWMKQAVACTGQRRASWHDSYVNRTDYD
jgi:predicted carbohydrate-binding protein with CBM5 and CBM33 domain